jgi:hypothetical protein
VNLSGIEGKTPSWPGKTGVVVSRFFFGGVASGRLWLRDIPHDARWNSERIIYWDETYIDGVSRLALAGHKIRSLAELDDMIAASRELPGTRTLWIHEGLLDEVQRRWKTPRAAAKRHWHVRGPAMVAAGVAVTFIAGLMAVAQVPQGPRPVLRMRGDAALGSAASPAAVRPRQPRAAARSVRHRAALSVLRETRNAADVRRKTAYVVSVGTFASAMGADLMKHIVGGKGYIVFVVPRGPVSQVTTHPYRTREQAERIVRGLEAAGVPARLTAWRGDLIASF